MAARPDAHCADYSGAAGCGGSWDYLEFGMTDLRQAAQQALDHLAHLKDEFYEETVDAPKAALANTHITQQKGKK